MRSTLCVSSDTCRSCPTSCLFCHQIPADITCVKYLPVITVHSTTSGELLFFIHSSGTNMRPVWLTAQTSTALTPSCPVTPTTVHRQLRIYCPKQVKLSKYTNKYYFKKTFPDLIWSWILLRMWKGSRFVHVDLCILGQHAARNRRDSHRAVGCLLPGRFLQRREHALLFGLVIISGRSVLRYDFLYSTFYPSPPFLSFLSLYPYGRDFRTHVRIPTGILPS